MGKYAEKIARWNAGTPGDDPTDVSERWLHLIEIGDHAAADALMDSMPPLTPAEKRALDDARIVRGRVTAADFHHLATEQRYAAYDAKTAYDAMPAHERATALAQWHARYADATPDDHVAAWMIYGDAWRRDR